MAQIIFQVNEQLDDNEDVLITKLISGKVTFVHRKIWSEVVQIASAREAWQLNKLPLPAKTLLEQVDAAGSLTTAEVSWPKQTKMKLGDAARELEKRLLIVGTQFHSETGAHQKQLETWNHWMKRRKFNPVKKSIAEAKGQLELILGDLNKRCNASGRFPWQ